MAIRKRSTVSRLTLFQLRRAKRLRTNADVPIAVERFSGRYFFRTWLTMKCAVFALHPKRRKGRHG